MINQDELRKQCRIAKAVSNNELSFKELAQAININDYSFYNWINGSYELSDKKARYLQDIVVEWQE
jgi:ribosome-binding protein aMBF1 (putative translation factor)